MCLRTTAIFFLRLNCDFYSQCYDEGWARGMVQRQVVSLVSKLLRPKDRPGISHKSLDTGVTGPRWLSDGSQALHTVWLEVKCQPRSSVTFD